jgi:hypothetical protein
MRQSNHSAACALSDYDRLTPAQKAAVEQAIELARQYPFQHSVRVGDGAEAYASPRSQGVIGWGVNGGHYGWCLARGTRR